MLSGISLFKVVGDQMRYLTERQTVIARNIANADTPEYKAQDLAPFTPIAPSADMATSDASSGTSGLAMTVSNPGHMQMPPEPDAGQQVYFTEANYGAKPNGNTVSVEEQMVKSADVANAFGLASAAYSKSLAIMKLAVSG
jgi:flagellar basal-body rod protein FlgB